MEGRDYKMIRSMTGFGRASSDDKGRSLVIEIKSVNHRYIDLNIKMPRNLIAIEDRIRKILGEKISRGKVDVFITQKNYESETSEAYLNNSLATSYLNCLKQLKDKFNLRDDISVSQVARFPDVITVVQKEENLEEMWISLRSIIYEATDNLMGMRENEGQKLKEDILKRCNTIKDLKEKIGLKASTVVLDYKEKLQLRLKELQGNATIDENRIATEIAIYADKASIDEELVRLDSHILQLLQAMELNETVGRKLDFIVQEMNREANTIASKANDINIVNLTLNLKNEIEKIREQVQNIE